MSLKNQKVYDIPFHLRLLILGFDLLSFAMAYIISRTYLPELLNHYDVASVYQNNSYYLFFYGVALYFFYAKGHYTSRVPFWQQAKVIVKAIIMVTALTWGAYFVFHIPISLHVINFHWLLALCFLFLNRRLAFIILKRFCKSWYLPVTLLGSNQMVIDCMYAFYNDGHTGYHIKTIMLRDKEKKPICLDFIPEDHPPINLFDATKNYLDYITNHPDDFYILDLEGLRGDNRDRLIKLLEKNQIEYAIIPPIKRLHLYGMNPLYFFGNDIMVLHNHKKYHEPLYLITKRAIDIAVSAIALPILALFTLCVYLLKKIERSGTPLFYGGKRLGKNGREFRCWKFNTMHEDADKILKDLLTSDSEMKKQWDLYQKIPNDPRIDSTTSKILRQTSLDELPQIWNVFIGDMSLVGPRPILPQQTKEYGDMLHLYNSMRPGITGLWQVSGRNTTRFEQRIYWDSWYIKNCSLWHDIVILLKTIKVLWTHKGAS